MSFILLGILNSQAAGGGGAYDLLETTTLTSPASSVTFSGLGSYSDYAHLQIRATTRTDRPAIEIDGIATQLNNDTGTNYSNHRLNGDGTSATSTSSSADTSFSAIVTSTNAVHTGEFGVAVLDILDFSSTLKTKTLKAFSGALGVTYNSVRLSSGGWYDTSSITSITFTPVVGTNFVTNSRLSIYGIKGA